MGYKESLNGVFFRVWKWVGALQIWIQMGTLLGKWHDESADLVPDFQTNPAEKKVCAGFTHVYPLVNVYIKMENHHFEWDNWDNSLFLWPCSIAFCLFTRPGSSLFSAASSGFPPSCPEILHWEVGNLWKYLIFWIYIYIIVPNICKMGFNGI